MRWVGAAACCFVLAAVGCTSSGDDGQNADDEASVRRFVRAWTLGGAALGGTITGADSARLMRMLRELRRNGVVRSTPARLSRVRDGSSSFDGVVVLHFVDGGRLELTIRATLEGDRVLAEPAAVSTRLSRWERLRIERFGREPARGEIRSRSGTLLAEGRRVPARPALAPAVSLIGEALATRLAGRRARRLVTGEPARVLAEAAPARGEDVATSLDDAMQAAAERTLGEAPGALVAVDPRTGGIRALVSNPEPRAPDRSPATSAYSPGSTFKLVTAAAALEGRVLESTDVVPCPGRATFDERQIENFGEIDHGPITFERAFAVSCNTAFARIGVAVGTVRLLRIAQRLGFRVGALDGPGTISVPRSRSELAVWSFGAAGSLVSPLQLAGIGATIARGGRSVPPGWTDRSAPGAGALRETTSSTLVAMMEEVVATGTGRTAAVPGAVVAGKTGTADPRSPGVRSDAWFVGLAPSRETRVVAVGFLPGAGIGGDLAASLVRAFLIESGDAWR